MAILARLEKYTQALTHLYGQCVRLSEDFTDRRAVALLSRLEKHTQELTVLFGQVIRLTEEFNRRWSVE